ncbi:hypothetical protein X975_21970, partial [Stegodyphus mimosarum]
MCRYFQSLLEVECCLMNGINCYSLCLKWHSFTRSESYH